MSMKTQGTHLYLIDPADDSVITVGCVTSFDFGGLTIEPLENTCLSAEERSYEAGLSNPGTASFGINFDTADDSHTRLHQLAVSKATLLWAVGLSNGTDLPTVDSGGTYDLPATRSWIRFRGFMTSFPLAIAQNALVQSTIGIQVTGGAEIFKKTA